MAAELDVVRVEVVPEPHPNRGLDGIGSTGFPQRSLPPVHPFGGASAGTLRRPSAERFRPGIAQGRRVGSSGGGEADTLRGLLVMLNVPSAAQPHV